MIHRWEFSDGTVATWASDGALAAAGDSELAESLREDLKRAQRRRVSVRIPPPPGVLVDLELTNVWLVDRLFRTEAPRFRVEVVASTYTPRDEDIPPEMLAMVQRSRRWGPVPPGAIP